MAYSEATQILSDSFNTVRRIAKGSDMDAPDNFMGNAVRRVYKAVPQRAWMNDADIKDGKFMRDYRVEVPLDELKGLFGN